MLVSFFPWARRTRDAVSSDDRLAAESTALPVKASIASRVGESQPPSSDAYALASFALASRCVFILYY